MRNTRFRWIFIVLFGLFLLVIVFQEWYARFDFQKGWEAYEKGDYKAALREWTPLAEQGYKEAQFNLGVMYENGQGVAEDHKTAAQWYTRAAEQEFAAAQHNLGVMYARGQGITKDNEAAVYWYKRAAEQGYDLAQSNLGLMYATGRGVPEDTVYAYMWMNLGASSGGEKQDELRGRVHNLIKQKMTPSQIAKAQKLERECIRKQYKGC